MALFVAYLKIWRDRGDSAHRLMSIYRTVSFHCVATRHVLPGCRGLVWACKRVAVQRRWAARAARASRRRPCGARRPARATPATGTSSPRRRGPSRAPSRVNLCVIVWRAVRNVACSLLGSCSAKPATCVGTDDCKVGAIRLTALGQHNRCRLILANTQTLRCEQKIQSVESIDRYMCCIVWRYRERCGVGSHVMRRTTAAVPRAPALRCRGQEGNRHLNDRHLLWVTPCSSVAKQT